MTVLLKAKNEIGSPRPSRRQCEHAQTETASPVRRYVAQERPKFEGQRVRKRWA